MAAAGMSGVWKPSVRPRHPAVSSNRLVAKPAALVKKTKQHIVCVVGGRRVSSQQIKASSNISKVSLWGKAKAGKKSLLFPQVLWGGEEQGEQSRETRDASPPTSSSSPPAPWGTCGRKIASAVSPPPSSLQLWPGGLWAVVAFTWAGVSNLGFQSPLSPPKASSFTTEGLVPSLGGKAAATGQKDGSSWRARERTGSRLAERLSRASALHLVSASLLSHNGTTSLLPENNVGAFPHCRGEELVLSTNTCTGSPHSLGCLFACLLMGAVSWASTGSDLVLVSASAHLFFTLPSQLFFSPAPF